MRKLKKEIIKISRRRVLLYVRVPFIRIYFFSIIAERTAEKSPPIVHVSQITHSCVFIVYEFWFELCIKAKIDHYLNEFCWFDKHLCDVCV